MKIQYPIITISGKNHIEFIKHDEDLKKCNKRALKNKYYNKLILIDSNSNRYRIQSAEQESTIGILWGFNLMKGQQLKVRLIFDEKVEKIELGEFQDLLIKIINKNKYFWDSDGNLKERLEFIKNANSTKEIISKFTYEYYKKY
ncbi:hypothetical protein [Lunatimonas salinarum]|uniref:hypothetical protein n=1 Tax=Lunatimonas salinarum TaxID=1774590 RepID=UPI001AE026D5|nr:hypothetical protein [Lunatimonas salinarum]